MTTYKQLKDKIAQQLKIDEEISSLLNQLVMECAPYKEGDIVEINGYSHTGKKGLIESVWITADRHDGSIGMGCRASVLRSDGSRSKYIASWSEYHDPLMESALKNLK